VSRSWRGPDRPGGPRLHGTRAGRTAPLVRPDALHLRVLAASSSGSDLGSKWRGRSSLPALTGGELSSAPDPHTCRAWTRQPTRELRGWVFRDGVPELRARKEAPGWGSRSGCHRFSRSGGPPGVGVGAVDLLHVSIVRSAQPGGSGANRHSFAQPVGGGHGAVRPRPVRSHSLRGDAPGSPGVACRYGRERRLAAPELITQPWAGDDLGGNGSPRRADHRRPR